MIDLTQKTLPHVIVTDKGEDVEVKTDFRDWLRFERRLREAKIYDASVIVGTYVFDDKGHSHLESCYPQGDWKEGALEFLQSPCATPHGDSNNKNVFDYLEDGDYIVGAFQQAYGIDLTSDSMHWHKFLALFRSLPSETKLAQIVGFRAYDERTAKMKFEERQKRLRDAWSLPVETDEQVLDWQTSIFGGVTYG